MGFECGFSVVPKYKDTTIDEYQLIEQYLYWKSNPWNFESDNYPTWEKYWTNQIKMFNSDKKFPGEPDADKVKFYENLRTERNTNVIDFWCSVGRHFDGLMVDNLTKTEDITIWLVENDNQLSKLISEVEVLVEKYAFTPASVSYAFTENEDGSIVSIPCDGIELVMPDGSTRRVYTKGEFDSNQLFYCADDWLQPTYDNLYKCLNQIRDMHLNDSNLVWYWRSY